MMEPTTATDLVVEINHGQVYVYSAAPWDDEPGSDAVLRALDDARGSGRFVGVADGLVDLVSPVQTNFAARMRVETWAAEPPDDDDCWDHVVDVDLDVPTGRLLFEGSGGRQPVPCEVQAGVYRARVSGRGYADAGLDSYRLRLWTRGRAGAPELRRSWPGWSALG